MPNGRPNLFNVCPNDRYVYIPQRDSTSTPDLHFARPLEGLPSCKSMHEEPIAISRAMTVSVLQKIRPAEEVWQNALSQILWVSFVRT